MKCNDLLQLVRGWAKIKLIKPEWISFLKVSHIHKRMCKLPGLLPVVTHERHPGFPQSHSDSQLSQTRQYLTTESNFPAKLSPDRSGVLTPEAAKKNVTGSLKSYTQVYLLPILFWSHFANDNQMSTRTKRQLHPREQHIPGHFVEGGVHLWRVSGLSGVQSDFHSWQQHSSVSVGSSSTKLKTLGVTYAYVSLRRQKQ